MRLFLLLVPLLLLAGCAIIDNNAQPVEQADAYLFGSCGPADGPAMDIIIPTSEVNSCRDIETIQYTTPWSQTFTRIYLFEYPYPLPEDSVITFNFGRENRPESNNGTGGWAGLCREGEDECTEASRGSIGLPRSPLLLPPPGVFDTRVEIRFENEAPFIRELEVKVCQPSRPILCG